MTAPAPSKRAKSTSARDLRYGRQGGRWAPLQSDREQAAAFKEAAAEGRIVRAHCACESWWLAPRDAGTACGNCGTTMESGEAGHPVGAAR